MTTGTAPGLKYEPLEGGVVRLIITGKLDAERVGALWTPLVGQVVGPKLPGVEVDDAPGPLPVRGGRDFHDPDVSGRGDTEPDGGLQQPPIAHL